MLRALLRKHEARRLNRDAVTVIESDSHFYGKEHLAAIAAQVDEYLQLARGAAVIDGREAKTLERLKAIHREARTRHDQIALSAATLAIIYFRARGLGEAAQPARNAIERFMTQYLPAAAGDRSA